MSKLTNDSLTRSGTVYSCTHMATVGVEGLRDLRVAFKQVRTEPQSCLSIHLCAFWDEKNALFSDVVSCCLVLVYGLSVVPCQCVAKATATHGSVVMSFIRGDHSVFYR